MALLSELSLEAAQRLSRSFGLDVRDVEPLAAGSVNSNFVLLTRDGQRFFGRVYEEQGREGADAELRLLRELDLCGLPVATPLRPRSATDEHSIVQHEGKPFAIFPWIEGEIVCQARVTPEQCAAVGRALAQVHLATPKVSPLSGGRFKIGDLHGRLDHVQANANPELVEAAIGIRQKLDEYAQRRDPALPQGLIHGDLFRDNVLFAPGDVTIAALLDFESASFGAFVFDIAVTALAWCYTDRLEPELTAALFEAYHAVRPLTERELSELVTEGALACLRFATTRITDFAMRTPRGTKPGRDYRRFLERLHALETGALDPALRGVTPVADKRIPR